MTMDKHCQKHNNTNFLKFNHKRVVYYAFCLFIVFMYLVKFINNLP